MKVLKHPLVLLLAVSSLASCRLVTDFMVINNNNRGCPQFFLNSRFPPTVPPNGNIVNRYQQICQEYMGVDRFATLYDTENKIPVYSAYLHVLHTQIDRMDEWWTEPELSIARQARNRDYTNSGYNRGHLYPAHNNNDPEGVDATFTLTNAAPQDPVFNEQWYHRVQQPVNLLIQNSCRGNPGYIVTGVVPDPIHNHFIGKGVRISLAYWTAYCCWDNNGVVIAQGAYALYRNGTLPLNNANVQNLENHLNNVYYPGPFQVFGGRC